jgi:hypothetical protein
MKFFIALLIASALVAAWSVTSQEEIIIDVRIQPQSIKAGESAVLSWKVENANSLLISGIGRVNAEGSQQVSPLSTTKYTLVAENPSIVSSKTVDLMVSGGRGSDEFPQDYSLYRYPVTYRRSTASLVTFLEQIRGILQDDMTFSVRGPQSEGTRYLFITNRSERGYLMQPDDARNRIGRRRISYIVEVEPIGANAKEFNYTIKGLIEYKRRIEATWRIESEESMYRAESDRLNGRLNRLP